ncbi:MAG: hypothetical protein HY718_03285, partial [Planctomycetes bacterium]|nr:hypothetical protein [Planctomycetota bacterium]
MENWGTAGRTISVPGRAMLNRLASYVAPLVLVLAQAAVGRSDGAEQMVRGTPWIGAAGTTSTTAEIMALQKQVDRTTTPPVPNPLRRHPRLRAHRQDLPKHPGSPEVNSYAERSAPEGQATTDFGTLGPQTPGLSFTAAT